MTVALSSSFLRGALCSQKNASISAYIAFLLHICPPRVYYNFLPKAGAFVYWASGEKMGGMLKAFGMSSITLCMGWNGLQLQGKPKKRREGEGGGLELVWHIWSKGPVLLLSALLFHAEMYKRDRGNDELECNALTKTDCNQFL